MSQVTFIQKEYWGELELGAPKNNERKLKNEALFDKARYIHDTDEFLFNIATPSEENEILVCEHAFLRLCGISNLHTKSDAPDQWKVIMIARMFFSAHRLILFSECSKG